MSGLARVTEPIGRGLSRVWELSEVLVDARTPYQHVLIARTAQGVGLFCDDERQSTELSQLVYHEALLVPALLLADRCERVLVVGSSEGVVSRLAVAAGARQVDHVDIDSTAVRLCARHLPYGYTPEELSRAEQGDGPVRVHYADGWEFVHTTRTRYDVVVVDLPDESVTGDAQHDRLYRIDYLARCREVLAPGGVLTSQAGCPTLWRNDTLVRAVRRFRTVFDSGPERGLAGTVYFGSAEHEWAFLSGLADPVAHPVARMIDRLATLPYRPVSVDAATLRGGTVPPAAVRAACPP